MFYLFKIRMMFKECLFVKELIFLFNFIKGVFMFKIKSVMWDFFKVFCVCFRVYFLMFKILFLCLMLVVFIK